MSSIAPGQNGRNLGPTDEKSILNPLNLKIAWLIWAVHITVAGVGGMSTEQIFSRFIEPFFNLANACIRNFCRNFRLYFAQNHRISNIVGVTAEARYGQRPLLR